jgi:hypothetical protein
MGWASGSYLFDKVIEAAQEYMPDFKIRKKFYLKTIEAFEVHDWDTQDECLNVDLAYDEALYELHPNWKE